MAEHTRPAGDLDLADGSDARDTIIEAGGAGPSGSAFTDTGELGGMRGTADHGAPDPRDVLDLDDPEAGDAAAVTTTLGDVVGPGTSDLDGSALD